MQPLDVSVFGPMKKRWRTILNDWKEECTANGDNYASIPKQVRVPTVPYLLERYRYCTCMGRHSMVGGGTARYGYGTVGTGTYLPTLPTGTIPTVILKS
jgi:hypothetical protein